MRSVVNCQARNRRRATGTHVAVLFLRGRLQPAVYGISCRRSALPRCLRLLAPLYLSASGDLGIPDEELRARRKPRVMKRSSGEHLPRFADRQYAASLPQQPPRYTRSEPSFGPVGSLMAPLGYSPCLSLHHSQTFPCMSCRPQPFGSNNPTVWVRRELLRLNQPYSGSKPSSSSKE